MRGSLYENMRPPTASVRGYRKRGDCVIAFREIEVITALNRIGNRMFTRIDEVNLRLHLNVIYDKVKLFYCWNKHYKILESLEMDVFIYCDSVIH